MADELVTHYWLNYDIPSNRVRVSVLTQEGGWRLATELPPEQAVFLSDMLRNEKPIYLGMTDDGSPGQLHTKEEPTGENE